MGQLVPLHLGGQSVSVNSGANVVRAPPDTFLHKANIGDRTGRSRAGGPQGEHVVAALHQVPASAGGRIFVYGDSNCLDSSHMTVSCYPFLMMVLRFLTANDRATGLTGEATREAYSNNEGLPQRRRDVDFGELSTTLGGHPGNEGSATCGPESPLQFHDARPSYSVPAWSEEQANAARAGAGAGAGAAGEGSSSGAASVEAAKGAGAGVGVAAGGGGGGGGGGGAIGEGQGEAGGVPASYFADDAAQSFEMGGENGVPVPVAGVAGGGGGTPAVDSVGVGVGVAATSSFPVLGVQDVSFPEVDRRTAVGMAFVGLALVSLMLASIRMRRRRGPKGGKGGKGGGKRGGAAGAKGGAGKGKDTSEMTSRLLRRQAV
jgi:hypothetical protein